MKNLAKAVLLDRGQFVREMSSGKFKKYTLHITGKSIVLVAQNAEGSMFILGTSAGVPRVWTVMDNPVAFLLNCNIAEWATVVEGASA